MQDLPDIPAEHALRKIVAEWLAFLAHNKSYSRHTLVAYETDLRGFFTFLNGHLGEEISLAALDGLKLRDFRSWLASRSNSRLSSMSTARALSVVRSFYRHLEKQEKLDNPAVHNVRTPKLPKALPRALSQTQAMEAVSSAGDRQRPLWAQKRDIALLTLIYGCGLRISEALALTPSDIPPGTQAVTVTGKGNKQRRVPILTQVHEAIAEYRKHCPHTLETGAPLFRGARGGALRPEIFQKEIRLLRAGLGLPDTVTPHAFRHSFATHLLAGGGDLRSIQELLGHADLSTTQRYTGIDRERFLSVYSKTHPRA